MVLKTYSKVLGVNGETEEEERKIYDDAAAMLASRGMQPDIPSLLGMTTGRSERCRESKCCLVVLVVYLHQTRAE